MTTLALLAYTGPGSAIGGLGALLSLIGVVLLAVVAFFWYPIKRLLGLGKKADPDAPTDGVHPNDPAEQKP